MKKIFERESEQLAFQCRARPSDQLRRCAQRFQEVASGEQDVGVQDQRSAAQRVSAPLKPWKTEPGPIRGLILPSRPLYFAKALKSQHFFMLAAKPCGPDALAAGVLS
ncbi:hypothetical protein ACE10X_21325 [Bradyrhizobium sp. Pha-3]|uniref:hypothetical protein n=1 Tax=Bradyrhizobium sp. Pha-3 TaxID=208375 RepID=UPI0035D4C503